MAVGSWLSDVIIHDYSYAQSQKQQTTQRSEQNTASDVTSGK